jgi:MATE family multidrug resistance protein
MESPTTAVPVPEMAGANGATASAPLRVSWKQVLQFAAPVSVAQILQFGTMPITLAMVGPLGSVAIGAVSLSFSLFNATGYSLIAGLSGALDTLLSQLHGVSPGHPMYGTIALRMALLLMWAILPVAAVMAYLDVILAAVGMPEEVVRDTAAFTRVQMFGLPAVVALEVLRRYLQNQNVTRPIACVQAIGIVVHVVLQYLSVRVWDLGLAGSAAAWVVLMVLMDAALLLYIACNRERFRATWPTLSRDALSGWGPLLRLGLPAWGMTVVEWSSFELCNASSGFLSTTDFAAYSIVLQCYAMGWAFCNGFFYAGGFFAGESIGRGEPQQGRRVALLTLRMNLCLIVFNSTILAAFGGHIATIFTDNEAVRARAHQVFLMAALFHFGDSTQSCCIGIARGIGFQLQGAAIMAVTWLIVGLPLNVYLAFYLGLGAPALYMGFFIASVTVGLPAFFYVLFRRTDWDELKAADGHHH